MRWMNLKTGTWVRADRISAGLYHRSVVYSSIISTSLTQHAGDQCDLRYAL